MIMCERIYVDKIFIHMYISLQIRAPSMINELIAYLVTCLPTMYGAF